MSDMVGDFIKIERATDAALHRLVLALTVDYEAILEEETELLGYTSGGAPYLYNPAPETWIITRQELLEDLPRNMWCFGVIYPYGPDIITAQRTGGMGVVGATLNTDVVALVVASYAPGAQDLLDPNGLPASDEAWLLARARAHKAAIMRSIYYYARDTGNDIEKVLYDVAIRDKNQFTKYAKDKKRISVGYTNWRLTQKVAIPERRPRP